MIFVMHREFPRPGRSTLMAAAAIAVAFGLTGCIPAGVPISSAKPSEPGSSTSTAEQPLAVTDITDDPGSGEGLVGALADSVVESCELKDGAWAVKGTVTNPTEALAKYRIYVSLLSESGETRAVQQVNADKVDAAATSKWSTTVPTTEKNLSCVLRVERYPG